MAEPRPIGGAGGGGGKGGGGASGAAPHEDPNDLRSNAQARLIDLVSEGEIHGLASGARSILINGTPLQDSLGNFNFAGVTWDGRTGLPDQDYLPGYPAAEATNSVNVEVKNGIPIIRTVTGPVDAVRVTLMVPQLTYQNPKTGDLHGYSLQMTIRARKAGTSAWTIEHVVIFSGKTIGAYERAIRIELGGETDWEIQVSRDTADTPGANYRTNTWWSAVTSIVDGKFKYPNSAYFGLTIDAKQFGSSVPARAYDIKGIKLQVPNNYDPATRTYTGIWNGGFKVAWSDNPAWVLYDILTNKRYGLGGYLNAAQIDKWSLYNIARYCDELVPDGFGGMEPRFRFNYQLNAAGNAYNIIQSIASCFRGLTFWSSGLVFVAADMPSDPVKLITPANVREGLFTYEGTALSARHSVAMVTWFDPDDQCRPAIELVEDPELLALYGWRPLSLAAYGCTSRGQAHRMGKWALDSERYATETVNYQAAWDHMDTVPGDIVALYDPDYAGIRLGGRLEAATSNSLTLDAPLTIEPGKTYTIKVVLPDNSLASRVLTNAVGTTATVTFADALAVMPVAAALYGITVSDLSPRQFRVLSVKEDSEGWFTVSAILHDPTKYARVEQGIKLEPVAYSRQNSSKPERPINLAVNEYLYRYGADIKTAATLSWQAANESQLIQGYEVQRRRQDGNWEILGSTGNLAFDVRDCEAGYWSFRVRATNFNGLPSAWLQKDVVLFGLDAPPATVQNFTLHILNDQARLSWDANPDLDLAFYRIKFFPQLTGATWNGAVELVPNTSSLSASLPAMAGTYLIKAVDLFGNESTAPALVVTNVSGLSGLNAIAAMNEAPTWPGVLTGIENIGGALQLTSSDVIDDWPSLDVITALSYGTAGIGAGGTYDFDNYFDLGAVYTSRVTALVDAVGQRVGDTMNFWPVLADIINLSGADGSDWSVVVEIQTTDDDPSAAPVWSAWKRLVVGDYTFRAIQARVVLESYDKTVTPIVTDVTITIDMPDRVDGANNISVPSGGVTVTFSPAFRAIPAIGLTGQDLATGDYWQYSTGPSASGFSGGFKNSAGAGVARTMDWIARGYGYQQ